MPEQSSFPSNQVQLRPRVELVTLIARDSYSILEGTPLMSGLACKHFRSDPSKDNEILPQGLLSLKPVARFNDWEIRKSSAHAHKNKVHCFVMSPVTRRIPTKKTPFKPKFGKLVDSILSSTGTLVDISWFVLSIAVATLKSHVKPWKSSKFAYGRNRSHDAWRLTITPVKIQRM